MTEVIEAPPTLIPMTHQIKMAELGRNNKRWGHWLEPGTGKTIGTLMIVEEHPIKTVVVCPKSVMKAAWVTDCENFFPHLSIACCWANSKKKRMKLIEGDQLISVINIDLFKKHRQDFINNGVRRLVFDESSMGKNHKAQRTKAIIEFADQMESVHLLSGIPAPNCPTEYYTQIRAINKHIFGPSFYGFAARYFYPVTRPIHGKDVITGYKIRTDRASEFYEKLESCSWSLAKEDAIDLPPKTDVLRLVDLDPKDRATYDTIYAGMVAEMEGEILSPSAQAKAMKLRQICNGFYYRGEETLFTHKNPKLLELGNLLDELGREQVIIWRSFVAEKDILSTFLAKRGATYMAIDSSNSDECIKAFQAGDVQYLLCNPDSVGHGITITAASYAIYYSLGHSYDKHSQSKDRNYRVGQTRPCTYYYLLADNTIEKHILWLVRNKAKLSDAILRMLKQPPN